MIKTPRLVAGVLTIVALLAGAAACSDSDSSTSETTTTTTVATSTPDGAATADQDAPILVVVTNDDGIDAPGIDAVAQALSALDGITVEVVAPATNQSGTSDTTTDGDVTHQDAATASGIEGTAVNGTPADSVNVALGELGLEPDLIVSGINKGQNAGPLVEVSGTVGAARTAVRNGVPAVAGSAGLTDPDYESAVDHVVAWVQANRDRIAQGDLPTDEVVNINVPHCTAGSPHDLVDVPAAEVIPEGVNPFEADCAATPDDFEPTDDIDALANGFAARTIIPAG